MSLVETRLALHAVAEHVLAPLRTQLTGNEIALTTVSGGFGTPELPGGGWVGVVGTSTVVVAPDGTRDERALTTLSAAADHVGLTGLAVEDRPLAVDPTAAARIAEALTQGRKGLEALLALAGPRDDPSPIHLWPEHFDIAIELGAPGHRANYGLSPGDEHHPEPYAYVGPWDAPPAGWTAVGFPGTEAPAGPAEALVRFWVGARAQL